MKTNQDLIEGVLQEAREIPMHQITQPHMPVNVYITEFKLNLMAMDEDENRWLDAGFDWLLRCYFQALIDELNRTQSMVVLSRMRASAARKQWLRTRSSIITEWKRLIKACKIVCADDAQKMKILANIADPTEKMDRLADLQAMTRLGFENLDRMSKLRIGGKRIDERYLLNIQNWAMRLGNILNDAEVARQNRLMEIPHRNRLVMLCRRAESEIDTWLDTVYLNNSEKKAAYTCDYFRVLLDDSLVSSEDEVTRDIDPDDRLGECLIS